MAQILIIVAIGILLLWYINQRRSSASGSSASAQTRRTPAKRIRLTNEQILCLASACDGKIIYAELPKFKFAQMPPGSICYELRTVKSLEKRGYLQVDERGGYIKTDTADQALRSAMGF